MRNAGQYNPSYANWESGSYPPDWEERRKKALNRDNYRCQSCAVRSTRVDDIELHVDHIVPKSDGGGHGLNNLQTLCVECHSSKHPSNQKLAQRARAHRKRNTPFILTRFLLFFYYLVHEPNTVTDYANRELAVQPLSSLSNLPEGEAVTVEATVDELWEQRHEDMNQIGLLRDGSAKMKFVVWQGNGVPKLIQGDSYRFVGAETTTYDGKTNLKLDQFTEIQRLD